jgi:DNA-binding MarR family transcriptional regulator
VSSPSLPRRDYELLVRILAVSRLLLKPPAGREELSVPEALLIWWLTRFPGCTAGQLAEDLGLEPSGLSVLLQPLLRRRLVGRLADPRDRRRTLLRATEAGRAALAPSSGRLDAAFASIAPEAIAAAAEALEGLARALRTRRPPWQPRIAS